MMEVKQKKKLTGKGTKTSQEKNRFYKNNGKIALPKYAFHVACLAVIIEGRGLWDGGLCS